MLSLLLILLRLVYYIIIMVYYILGAQIIEFFIKTMLETLMTEKDILQIYVQ